MESLDTRSSSGVWLLKATKVGLDDVVLGILAAVFIRWMVARMADLTAALEGRGAVEPNLMSLRPGMMVGSME